MLTSLLVAALLSSAPLSATPIQGRTPAPVSPGNTSTETAEGVEILRRVLIESLDKAFVEKPTRDQVLSGRDQVLFDRGFQTDGLVTRLWAGGQTVQHARAFHMPEAGLFFALDLSLPVVKKEGEAGTEQPENDEWERARQEVRGAPDGVRLRLHRREGEGLGEIDPKAIEQVTDLVLRTLARHISRIEGLGSHETVTVALRLSGKDRSWLHEWSGDEPHGRKALDEEDPEVDEPEQARSMAFSAYVLATGQEVREQNLVLRIPLADLMGAEQATPEQLRRTARVNRY
jgi:hypothetical protein